MSKNRLYLKYYHFLRTRKFAYWATREFCSVKLANYLRELDVYFCLRLKKNHFIESKTDVWLELKDLGLSPGVS